MTRLMGASGQESLNVAASLFLGQTEAPLTIRPYLPKLTKSELLTVMTSGMADVSGGTMAAYFAFGIEPKHVLTAVIMTAPGTILLSKMLVPETGLPETGRNVRLDSASHDANLLDAASRGTREGLQLAVQYCRDAHLVPGTHHAPQPGAELCQHLTPKNSWYVARARRVSSGSAVERLSDNRRHLGNANSLERTHCVWRAGCIDKSVSKRAFVIATYALCGFANLSSIGIQLGGIGRWHRNRARTLRSWDSERYSQERWQIFSRLVSRESCYELHDMGTGTEGGGRRPERGRRFSKPGDCPRLRPRGVR